MTQNLSYEKAFERLEKILELMNSGKTPLDESLKLFEEAELLMRSCTHSLNQAEKTIEKLIKGRNNDLQTDENQKPKTESFQI
ncbi:MAG TPA: exodeoxyribonuclease VII small subunit [Chlamydiales bacterium]|nr:exodeoxyribonuclease VII small subunit [Chlamydiales bacterium]